MKVTVSQLANYLKPSIKRLPADKLIEQLTMAGLEVDDVQTTPEIKGVVVGKVTEVKKHPNADKLKVCAVDTNAGKAKEVVCGAPNVRVGLLAPFAPEGARLGDMTIKRATLRGVASQGMLCSAQELGLESADDGLLELDADSVPGKGIEHYVRVGLGDTKLSVDLTPNRPDCFSVRGIARDIAALKGQALSKTSLGTRPLPKIQMKKFACTVELREPQACPRYLASVVKNIDRDAVTPLWIRERLWAGGMQSVHPIVDTLNMWMLEIGQPMHAFDADKLSGKLVVRFAKAGEKMTALGGEEMKLAKDCLVIADDKGPVAVAGIIGGARAGVTEATSNVLLECAFFNPAAIMGRARALRTQTEASTRFERGVDWNMQEEALTRALGTIAEWSPSAQIGGIVSHCRKAHVPKAKPVRITSAGIESSLGVNIEIPKFKAFLKASGCAVTGQGKAIECKPPAWRFDLRIPADLIEEAGRFYGYERIPEIPDEFLPPTATTESMGAVNRIRDALRGRGYSEAVTLSFGDPDTMTLFSDDAPMVLDNPISPDLAVMRTSLWPGLLKALLYNVNRNRDSVRLFEYGRSYSQAGDAGVVVAGLAYGFAEPEQWGASSRACDFYDIKGDLESVCDEALRFERAERKGLHPGQTARILNAAGKEIGCIGALSPTAESALDISGAVFLFELHLDKLSSRKGIMFEKISKYPQVRNDISLLISEDIAVGDVIEYVEALKVEDLKEVFVFDIFQGGSIEKNEKSISLCLIYRRISSTLSGEESAQKTHEIVNSLCEKFNARLRQ